MPRLTYEPSDSSEAARAAISSRFHGMSVLSLFGGAGAGAHGALLDPLVARLLVGQLDDALHVDAGGVHVVRFQLARVHEVLDLGDGDPPAHRRQRVEVARGVAVDEVAVPVALPGPDQPEVGGDRLLEDVLPGAVLRGELSGLLRR